MFFSKQSAAPSFTVIVAIVFLSRLPFITASSYGIDSDAWRVAAAAKSITETGEYKASRLPGYPIQEIAYSLVSPKTPFVFNAITAVFSGVAVAFFWLSLRAFGVRDNWLGAAALAFTPVLFINSTTSMDYVWSLAFMMGGLYFSVSQMPVLAGLMLGLAIGCRITAGAMVLPFAFFLADRDGKLVLDRKLLWFGLTMGIVGLLAFAPVFFSYGFGFFTFYDADQPALIKVFNKATLGTWGVLGFCGVLLGFGFIGFRYGLRRVAFGHSTLRLTGLVAAILLFVIAFIRLPHESGYLIPLVPYLLILFGLLLERRVYQVICILIAFSPFVFGIAPQNIVMAKIESPSFNFRIGKKMLNVYPFYGQVLIDKARRTGEAAFIKQVLSSAEQVSEKSVVICGAWLSLINGLMQKQPTYVTFIYLPEDATEFQHYADAGYHVYYLPDIDEFSLNANNFDLAKHGATPFPLSRTP
jgi:hypothetical protein